MSQNLKHDLAQVLGQILGPKKVSIELHTRAAARSRPINVAHWTSPNTPRYAHMSKTLFGAREPMRVCPPEGNLRWAT